MTSRQKHKAISLETKHKVIKLLDNCTPYPQILDQFRDKLRGSYNISKINKNRYQIICAHESSYFFYLYFLSWDDSKPD